MYYRLSDDVDGVRLVLQPQLLPGLFGLGHEHIRAEVELDPRLGVQKLDQLGREKVPRVKVDVQKSLEMRVSENSELLRHFFRRRGGRLEDGVATHEVVEHLEGGSDVKEVGRSEVL